MAFRGGSVLVQQELTSVRRLRESKAASAKVCPNCFGPLNKMGECAQCTRESLNKQTLMRAGGPGSGPKGGRKTRRGVMSYPHDRSKVSTISDREKVKPSQKEKTSQAYDDGQKSENY